MQFIEFNNIKNGELLLLMKITGFECGGADVLRVIKFIMSLLDVICIVVPIGLIIMISIDFARNVISGKEDEMKKKLSLVIKRLIFTVALFLVPTIVSFTISLLEDQGVDYAGCIEIATTDDISKYEVEWPEDYNSPPTDLAPESSGREVVPDDQETDTSNSNESNEENFSNNTTTTSNNIFIGDSRCEGMKQAIGNGSSNDIWICKNSEGYNWLKATALNTLNEKINPSQKYNIIINLGVNDFDNIDKYITLYNEMKSTYKNHNIIIVSVNPIRDTKARTAGYEARNSKVTAFNKKLKSELANGIKYCDTYSKIISSFDTSDGIHYTSSTYQKIYDEIKACL